MDEREMFEAWVENLDHTQPIGFDIKHGHDGAEDVAWAAWQAARRTTPDREAILEECAEVCDAAASRRWYAEDRASDGCDFCAEEIRNLKTAPTPAQPFSLTEDDPQEGVAFQYANELVAKRLRGDKGGA